MSGQRARERTRRTYTPAELRVLFIGESPRAAGGSSTTRIPSSTSPRLGTRASFLDTFQRLGCYLEDLSLGPIDKLPKPEKRRAREAAVPALARRLRGLAPRLVVVVVKGIRPQVDDALDRAGLGAVPCEALPFPGQWHRAHYVAELKELVRQWRRRRLLRAGV